jgi:hypothetical protein
MFRLIIPLLIIGLFSCVDKGQIPLETNIPKDTSLKIIVTGLTDLETITQLDSLAKKYAFKYYPLGCVVTKQLMDSVEKENNITYKILEKRYGKNWRNNFNSQYYTVSRVRLQADSLINKNFPHDNKYFHYVVMPNQQKNGYQIKVYSTDSLNGKSELIVHYKIAIVLGQVKKVQITKTFEKL